MNKVLTILVIILGLSSTFANENKQKKSRMIDRFRYEKYIDKPIDVRYYNINKRKEEKTSKNRRKVQ